MSDQPFDRFVRDKLADRVAPVPAGLWDRIERAQRPRRRRPFFFLLAGGLVVVVSSLLLYSSMHSSASLKTANTAGAGKTIANKSDLRLTATSAVNPGRGHSNAGGSAADQNTALKLVPGDKPAQRISIRSLVPADQTDPANNRNAVAHNITIADIHRNTPYRGSQNFNSSPSRILGQPGAALTDATTHEAGFDNGNEALTSLRDTKGTVVPMASLLTPVGVLTPGSAAARNLRLNYPVIPCPPSGSGNPAAFYVEAFVSPDWAMKSVTGPASSNAYLALKDSAESMQVSYSAGIRLVKPIGQHFSVKTGLQYTQANEKLTYRSDNESQTVTVVTVHTIVRAPGDTIFTRDTSTYAQAGYRYRSVNNSYRAIDIPLLVGYEWGNENWQFGVHGGATFNIRSWYNGQVLDSTSGGLQSLKSGGSTFKTQVGLSVYLALNIAKRINDRLEIFAEPSYRQNLSNTTQQGAPFNQKIRTAGLGIGIRYQLSGGQRFTDR